jgi:hypothetical protein
VVVIPPLDAKVVIPELLNSPVDVMPEKYALLHL